MSREHEIRQVYAALTSAALEALANKGLLRRAQKDVERGEVGALAFAEDMDSLTVTVSGHRVRLPIAGPGRAACSCPAAGVCQHILAACLSVTCESSSNPSEQLAAAGGERVREEWLAPEDAALVQTFSLPVMRAAYELLQQQEPLIHAAADLVVRFPHLNAEIRGLPGTGLAGILVSGSPEKKHDLMTAAALQAVRRIAGKNWEPPALKTGSEAAGATRAEVLPAVTTLLEEMVAAGLARLTESEGQRLESLGVSAQAAGLPRLSLLLQRLATQVGDWLDRRPQADLARLLADAAQAYALTQGLDQQAQPHLTGTPREKYAEVGTLQLSGVAAWPWRTASGYEGLTVLFWDLDNKDWSTWTEARPKAFAGGFSAVGRYTAPGPWEGADSPSQLAGSRFRLMKARRNRWGRLSASSQSQALVTGSSNPADILAPVVTNWEHLERQFAAASRPGLREHDPRQAFHLLQPARWERQPFDPVSQSLCWYLMDDTGRALLLRVVYDDLTKPLIEALENFPPDELTACRVIGRVHREGGHLVVHPLGLLRESGPVVLAFPQERSAAKPARTQIAAPQVPKAEEGDEEEEIEETTESATPLAMGPLQMLLSGLVSSLEWMAEGGTSTANYRAGEELREWQARAKTLSLAPLLPSLEVLCARPRAAALLRCRWIVSVYQSLDG
ncbi:hypothetical protein [Verrucomicrobium sp. BvORR106]|uniref:hypothetical protein n=1 Tax=Verrucomicrobium sp. BvORR106 TaxID=1403819 RepID=UPI000570442D|nr:hypothetical protein [Verrucomicrobium sp. BvORR106]